MTDKWEDRLRECVERDRRSMRAISIAAGKGENYVSQLLKDRGGARLSDLLPLLETLGPSARIYVLTGLNIEPSDVALVEAIAAMPEDARANLRQLVVSLSPQE